MFTSHLQTSFLTQLKRSFIFFKLCTTTTKETADLQSPSEISKMHYVHIGR